jgi:RNA polymerase sigma-70 factor, ECF subfamily
VGTIYQDAIILKAFPTNFLEYSYVNYIEDPHEGALRHTNQRKRMKDDQAVTLLKQGDQQGMEVLVSRYYLPAVRAAYLILQDKGLAEDIVQNTFFGLNETIRKFDPNRPFGPWFLRCVVNAAINTNHRESRLVSIDHEEDEPNFTVEGWLVELTPGPAELAEESELRQTIFQALTRLTPKQRAAVVMRYYLDMSEAEMTEKLASPKSSLKWWLYSARVRLRGLLHTFGPADSPSANDKEKRR